MLMCIHYLCFARFLLFAGIPEDAAMRPNWVGVDEYDSPYDIGYTREYVEDQAGFITQDLDLPEEQQAYLLMKLGLLGASDVEDTLASSDEEGQEPAAAEAQSSSTDLMDQVRTWPSRV